MKSKEPKRKTQRVDWMKVCECKHYKHEHDRKTGECLWSGCSCKKFKFKRRVRGD